MEIVSTKNLKKYYKTGKNIVRAVDGIDISIKKGEFVAIVGKSGSGKSTLLNLLGGLDNPTKGVVIINNTTLNKLNDDELTVFRRRNIGFVFQNYNLIPALTVLENIMLPLGIDNKNPEKDFIDELIKILGLEDKRDELPSNLSGGQQQRVAIGRALASKPSIILADEPTGNLDSKTEEEVLGLLKVLIKKYNQTVIMITHNNDIAKLADRIITIKDGKVGVGDNICHPY